MKKLSGLVLDAADDYNGEVLRSIFPTRESVPDLIKQADGVYLKGEKRASLPDDLFALVLQDEGMTLRKYACVDAGNTALNVEYFLKVAYKLPEEAQKTAAANLCVACNWYGIEPPESLQKIALGLGAALHLGIMGPTAYKTSKEGIKQNLATARASGSTINPAVLSAKTPPVVR